MSSAIARRERFEPIARRSRSASDAENPEATQWDYRYRDSAPLRGLPIVPTLGVRGQW